MEVAGLGALAGGDNMLGHQLPGGVDRVLLLNGAATLLISLLTPYIFL